ncbi:hypothetical protein ACFU3E_17235 [Streptomyces sp. NPDC057424]|uniref:hypothetical protein n=1 Tax=Streptomyces sp. NPDC057424 TaxID=3346127 RepID=UPI003688C9E8
MNAEQWNELYPVGALVFAYPGCRPEDGADTRLVTRTRSKASVLGGHTDVVWVDGHSACIALSHVDPVTEEQFAKARAEETAAAVAAEGALPVPVGDQPQPLDDARLAEIAARVEKASRGPWTLAYEYCDCSEDCGHGLYVSRINTGAGPATELVDLPNGEWELMVHAREDIPALLAEVERLKATLAKYVGAEPTIAEEMAYLSRSVEAVTKVCDEAERQARRWEDPLPVPEWVGVIRHALELAPKSTVRAEEA